MQTDKTEKIIKLLKEQQPKLIDATGLTDNIIHTIELQNYKLTTSINWFRVISSSAAIFLLCLFVFQQTETKGIAHYNNKNSFENLSISADLTSNIAKKDASLLNNYQRYMQYNALKNKKMYSITQSLN